MNKYFKNVLTIIFFILTFSFHVFGGVEAIYGIDNRSDVYASRNPLFVNLAKSTAAMVDKMNLKVVGDQTILQARNLGEMYHLCPDQRFRNQPTVAGCSGTLIAPDIIMTAGHCYDLAKETCRENVWVFDYKVDRENQASVSVPNSNIYECEKVLLKEMNVKEGIDHALIKLKRIVEDRNFARIRDGGEIALSTSLVLIGHPSGLPTKIADDGHVLKIAPNYFLTNLDAFTVNSGSGVFNAQTGIVEGILVSGQMDYDGKGQCSSVVNYEMNSGNETVVKVDKLRTFLQSNSLISK